MRASPASFKVLTALVRGTYTELKHTLQANGSAGTALVRGTYTELKHTLQAQERAAEGFARLL